MRSRYVQINGELVPVDRDWTPEPRSDIHIIPDIDGYQSMQTGEWISSRSKHRAHLKQHGLIEVGNEKLDHFKGPQKRVDWKSAIVEQFKRRGLLS